ncbi:MAG: DUF6064 family protein [Thermoanaerobaculia bacterium]|nr:DUF6064 family protein [Thermoanaerobaculia bacterium]
MSEWWTYRPSDLLMFSPETYYRLFELYNRDLWPLHLLSIAAGIALLVTLLSDRPAWRGRLLASVLALAWAWVAWAFLLERYATINWAAKWLALGFGLQALLLLSGALARNGLDPERPERWKTRGGISLAAFAVLVQPLVGPLLGRSWNQAELFGLAPDPTVVATLGVVVLARSGFWRAVLLPIPLLWCAISGTTLRTMGSPDWVVLPVAGVVAIVLAWPGGEGRDKGELPHVRGGTYDRFS